MERLLSDFGVLDAVKREYEKMKIQEPVSRRIRACRCRQMFLKYVFITGGMKDDKKVYCGGMSVGFSSTSAFAFVVSVKRTDSWA